MYHVKGNTIKIRDLKGPINVINIIGTREYLRND
jgi:hypothetical protein